MWTCEKCGQEISDDLKTCPCRHRREGSGRPVGTSRSTTRRCETHREAFLLVTPGFAQVVFYSGSAICVVLGIALVTRSDPPRVLLGISTMVLGPIVLKVVHDLWYMLCRIYEKTVKVQQQKQ